MRGISDEIAALAARIAELERRAANRMRVGVVTAADPASGRYRVRINQTPEGGDVVTPPISRAENAIGDIKIHAPLAIGEQVVILSENGEIADGIIIASLPSAARPRAHDQGGELVIEIGATRLTITAAGVEIAGGEYRVTADRIIFDGVVDLGGEGGEPVHRRGDADSEGHTAVGHASRVRAL